MKTNPSALPAQPPPAPPLRRPGWTLLRARLTVALSLFWLLLCGQSLQAQTPTHVYEFNGSYADTMGGPAMVPVGTSTVGASAYAFATGEGPNVSGVLSDTAVYSIEMVFSLANVSNYRCLLNTNNRTAEEALYVASGGQLQFYGVGAPSGTTDVVGGLTQRVVVTRAADKTLKAYVNGVEKLSRNDLNNYLAASGPSGILHFFRDNTTEHINGSVDQIRIYDTVLTPAQVATLAYPSVTSLTPANGPTAGGTAVTLTGMNFTGATAVTIGGAPATSVLVLNSTTITCVTPSGTAGLRSVVVTTPSGSNAANSLFTYGAAPTLTGISPASGPTTGGTAVTLTGTDFTGATSVTIGGEALGSMVVGNDTTITGVTPVGVAGAASVVVSGPVGSSAANSLFTYTQATLSVTFNAATDIGATLPSPTATGTALDIVLNFAPAPGTELMLVRNTGLPFINGTFTGLPNGAAVNLTYNGSTYPFVAWYYGGDGNDLVLLWPETPLAAWGLRGAAGDGNGVTDRLVPVAVQQSGVLAGKTIVQAVWGSGSALALTTEGRVYTWSVVEPVSAVSTTSGSSALFGKTVVAVAAGYHHCLALCSDGTVAAWAYEFGNQYGQLGDGTSIDRTLPVAVNTANGTSALFGKSVVAIAAGVNHSLALTSDGLLTAWGRNAEGQLGDTTLIDRSSPVFVNAVNGTSALFGRTVASFVGGGEHTLALCTDGTLLGWGGNTYAGNQSGQVGDNSFIDRTAPVLVNTAASALLGKTVSQIAAGEAHSLALCTDGTVAGWGWNAYGPVGDGTQVEGRPLPTLVNTAIGSSALAGKAVKAIAAGRLHSLALCTDGTVAAWGDGQVGQLGDNSNSQIPRLSPVAVDQTPGQSVLASELVTKLIGTGPFSNNSGAFYRPGSALPLVLLVTPAGGPPAGGTPITITGSNFYGATSVTIGGAAATITAVTPTSITATTPAGVTGPASVVVTRPSGPSLPNSLYTYTAPPTVTAISPSAGPLAGGATATITGTAFVSPLTVMIGGVAATAVTVTSPTSLTCTIPAGTAGPASVVVTNPSGSNAANSLYTYHPVPTVTAVSPNYGLPAGGNTVTITGTDLSAATSVSIGGNQATGLTILSATSLSCIAPARVASTTSVIVTTPGGQSEFNSIYTYLDTPVVSSISPNNGPLTGGATATISGARFMGPLTVTIDGVTAPVLTVPNALTITCTIPAGLSTGAKSVIVTTIAGSNAANTLYTYNPLPTVTAISPTNGPPAGGATATITGTGFINPSTVKIGGVSATSVVVTNSTTITCVIPAGTAGAKSVVVTNANGSNVANTLYTYNGPPTVTAISPPGGPLTAGVAATLTGTNFVTPSTVTVGGVAATSVVVTNSTTITCVIPAGTAGAKSVIVTNANGTNAANSLYTYHALPTVTSVFPTSGPLAGGNTITINGTNLSAPTAVTIGGVAATSVTPLSANSLSCVAPASGSTGLKSIVVTTLGGVSNPANLYSYLPLTTVTSVTPSSGPQAGGGTVSISGTGFSAGATVTIGGVAATGVTVNNSSNITCTVPAAASGGAVSVLVTAQGGTNVANSLYTYIAAPTVTAISSTGGPLAGGTTVTLTGTGFSSITGVTFGGVAATSVSVTNTTSLTCVLPANTAGLKAIIVTSSTAGASAPASLYTYYAVPTVTAANPTGGPLAGGNTVTLTGTGFVSPVTVTIGGAAATAVSILSPTSLTCVAPLGTAGAKSVVASTPGGTSAANSLYTYYAAPTVTGVAANAGPLGGGNTVTITGTNLISTTGVTIDGNAATGLSNITATSVTCVVPAGTAGAKSVVVTTLGGASNAGTYTYVAAPTVTAASPAGGPLAGGGTITLTGTDFVNPVTVTIGGAAATSVNVTSSTSLTCVVPAGSAGAASVVVTAVGGSNAANSLYTYYAAPTVTGLSPNAGPLSGGNTVTITGTNLISTTGVTIGGVVATGLSNITATSVTCIAPAGTAGVKSVIVTTLGGQNTANTLFTHLAAPVIYSILPNKGPLAGGATATIDGLNFASPATVSVGGVAATNVNVVSSTTITCTLPPNSPGVKAVTVTVFGVSTTYNGIYLYLGAPFITGVSPAGGPLAGGNTLTVTGLDFYAPMTVTVGGVAATSVNVSSFTSLTCVVPSGVAGPADVIVTSPSGSSNAGLYTYHVAPTVIGILPNNGPTSGGTPVTISGTNLATATAVTIGGVAATGLSNISADGLSCIVPASSTGGAKSVVVTTLGGQNAANALFTYTTVPEIDVFSGTGTLPADALTDNVGTQSMTATGYGTTSPSKSFTIKNSGTATLTGLARAFSGGYADEYSAGAIPTSLAPGATATVTVTFAPTSIGTRTATLLITSNDANENPFRIQLTGTGIVPATAPATPFGWGGNTNGGLGDGTTTNRAAAVPVNTSSVLAGKTVTAISAGYQIGAALTSDGLVSTWGLNTNGQLGNGTLTSSSVPVAVDVTGVLAGKTVTAMDCGEEFITVLTSEGKLYGWGRNDFGQLGDGTSTRRTLPAATSMTGVLAGKTITTMSSGGSHTAVLTTEGKVYAYGYGGDGQLGNGATAIAYEPVAVLSTGALSGKTVTAISAGQYFTLALTSDGLLYAWGLNTWGQLGDGTTTNRSVPVAVDMTGVLAGKTVTAISAGARHSLALTSDGLVFAWGYNSTGELGDGTQTQRTTPVAVATTGVLAGKKIARLAAGSFRTLVIGQDGKAYAWGSKAVAGGFTMVLMPEAVDMTGALAGKALATGDGGSEHFLVLATTVPVPEIAIEQPVGTPIASGASKSMGSPVNVGSSASLTFSVKNTGTAPLHFTSSPNAVSLSGSTDFTVGQPIGPVGAGGANFIVTFTPTSGGLKTATLTLANDDLDENPTVINLTGTGNAAPTALALSNSSLPENTAPGSVVGLLSTTDPDAGNTFSYQLVPGTGSADNGIFSIAGSQLRTSVLTPAPDFETKNSYAIRLRASDQGGLFFEQTFTITITNVNDMPSFTKGANQALPNGTTTPQGQAGWATVINDGDSTVTQALTFNVTNNNNALFTTQPAISSAGTLTFTPTGNAGTATVSVSLTDDATINGSAALTTAVQTFTITVAANTAPVITSNGGGATAALSIAENTTAVTTVIATDAETPAPTLNVSKSGPDAALFSLAGGVLAFASPPNFEAPADANGDGVYQVTVTITDNGAPAMADTQDLSITVANTNEMPSFTKGPNQSIPNGTTTPQSQAGWATGIDDGDSTVTQALTFNVTNNNNALFTAQPAVSSAGTLTFTPTGNAGTATVSVSLTDDASINGNAALTSAVQTFTITVAANTPPVITSNGGGATAAFSIAENTTAVTTVVANDAETPTPQLVFGYFGSGPDVALFDLIGNSLVFRTTPDFEHPTDANGDGIYEVTVIVSDAGAPKLSVAQALSITVTDVVEAVLATVTSPTSTSITATSATLGGNVTSDGGAAITERGIVYAETTTNNNPLISGSGVVRVIASGTTGVFTAPVASLTANTGYSFKGYAINSQGTSYTSVATFTTAASTNADLSALTLSTGTLAPAFASGTVSYTASVPNAVAGLTVTPTKADPAASIAVNGVAVASGSPSGGIALAVGVNTINIVVTAGDGTTTKSYTVAVTRQGILPTLSGDGTLVIDMEGAVNESALVIKVIDDPDGNYLEITDPNNLIGAGSGVIVQSPITIRVRLSSVTSLVINGSPFKDVITIDYGNGDPLPSGTITVNGGLPITNPGDTLVITGAFAVDGEYGPGSGGSGYVDVDGKIIDFTGLEPVDLSGMSFGHFTVNIDPANEFAGNVATTIAAVGADTDITFGSSGLESVKLGVVTGSLTVDGDNVDNDAFILQGLGSAMTGDFTVDAKGGSSDVIVVNNTTFALAGLNRNLSLKADFIGLGREAVAAPNDFPGVINCSGNITLEADGDSSITSPLLWGTGGLWAGTIPTYFNSALVPSMARGTIHLRGDIRKTAGNDATLTLKARGVIVLPNSGTAADTGRIISTNNKLHVVMQSDTDGANAGSVLFQQRSTITTNGGDLVIGGGATPLTTPANGLTGNTTLASGVNLVSSAITTGGGAISIRGQGGANNSATGVVFNCFAGSTECVLNSGSGDINITGTGGGGTFTTTPGVYVIGNASGPLFARVRSSTGSISINGTAQSTSATSTSGVLLGTASEVSASSTGNITLTGSAATAITTANADISTAPPAGSSATVSSAGGAVTLIGDSMNLSNGAGTKLISTTGAGVITVKPRSAGKAINLGAADSASQLGLLSAELGVLTAPTVKIGEASSGGIVVSTVIAPLNYKTLAFGNSVAFASAGGFSADVTSASVYERMTVAGSVTIASGASLNTVSAGGYVWNGTDRFTFLDNDGADAISGTFTGPALGNWLGSSLTATRSYTSGTGNDLTIGSSLSVLETWRLAYFGSAANSGNGANSFDADGDGLDNLTEYAFGLNPTDGSAQVLPAAQLTGGVLAVSFTQPAGVSGITYGAEWSPSLAPGSWTPIPDTGAGSVHTFSVPAADQRKFLRVTISEP